MIIDHLAWRAPIYARYALWAKGAPSAFCVVREGATDFLQDLSAKAFLKSLICHCEGSVFYCRKQSSTLTLDCFTAGKTTGGSQ
jgi:hypothetical protein